MASPSSAPPPLDFESLLSRKYRPARVTCLVPREAYHPNKADKKKKTPPAAAVQADLARQQQAEETSRFVFNLVSKTPAFTRHLPEEKRNNVTDNTSLLTRRPPVKNGQLDALPPAFHQVELGDWESKIDWEGASGRKRKPETSSTVEKRDSALALLRRPRNPHLDNISFDHCLQGTTQELMEKARRVPLILELGVAGQSVARHVYQNSVLSAQRPLPAHKSEAYRKRHEREYAQRITSTADVSKGTLHADKDKTEAIIEARQKKRAKMAVEKKDRVTSAMDTLALGAGRGRTITSSLMGPGGTERTGRPSRHMGSSAVHNAECIEQLDMVNSHNLVRDVSNVMLRQYHRPKLPLSVIRQDLSWQFQVRYTPAGKKPETPGSSFSYHSFTMGTHAGAVSGAKLRTEADLSPTEGNLILLEYSEERPPVQLTKGMASKIVNYYRGDKSRCPVSAGGGDRPSRRKRGGETKHLSTTANSSKVERPPVLEGPNGKTTVMDWVGELPKRSQKDSSDKEAIDVLPEGVTEILHPKVHGPFIGQVEEGTTLTGLISNVFAAPMFRHEPESTDFLMVLRRPSGAARTGERESMGVVLRDLPSSIYTVGQTEPRVQVHAPNTQGEKAFLNSFLSFEIARVLTRTQSSDGHGLGFDEIKDRVMPNLKLPANTLRQRMKTVAVYDKAGSQIWITKPVGVGDDCYPGVDVLGRQISPESIAAYETARAARCRLSDLGIHQLLGKGTHTVAIVGETMVYLAGQLNAARKLSRDLKKLEEVSKTSKDIPPTQITFYKKAAADLDSLFKSIRQKHEIAQFIFEELQLAPWNLTKEFIDVHKKDEGTGMMKLTGLGDPSGRGEAISFLRELDSKPSRSDGTLTAQTGKITGTQKDLRKLTMAQTAQILRRAGMPEAKIKTLKRWDRVDVIRKLSTKAASDGIGDRLDRFARGVKMRRSEQKQMYCDRIQVIWRRQIAALSAGSGDRVLGSTGGDAGMTTADGEAEAALASQAAQPKKTSDAEDDESDSDDDDLAAELKEEMMYRTEANQLVAAHAREKDREGGLGQLRAATRDTDLTNDARELAALKRQREEERAAQEDLQSTRPGDKAFASGAYAFDRKVIRQRITKTYANGRQTTTFKFICHPDKVSEIMARLPQQKVDEDRPRKREIKYEYGMDEKPPGHAMFEDDDDFEYSSKGRSHSGKRRGASRKRAGGRTTPRGRNLQIGKLKTKVSEEERMRKRKREEEELEVYAASAKRKGTSNRKERGSIRERRPHLIFADKLESIRSAVEARPNAGPFAKPVSRHAVPRYYEVISHPMDLQAIRDKISRYEYRTADALVCDFELMKTNAVKFNGQTNGIAQEAVAIFEFVRDQVESSRGELSVLEEAVDEQFSGKLKKKKQSGQKKSSDAASGNVASDAASGNVASIGGVTVNLGDLSQSMQFDGIDSDSDDSYAGLLK